VLPVEALRARVTATVDALCWCEREREVGFRFSGRLAQGPAVRVADRRHLFEQLHWMQPFTGDRGVVSAGGDGHDHPTDVATITGYLL
jgi:hypothetical protein